MTTLYTIFAANAKTLPNNIALICDDQEITYGELAAKVNALAFALHKIGVGKGSVVAAMMKNDEYFVELLYATLKLGAVVCPFNVRSNTKDIEYNISISNPSVFVYDVEFDDRILPIRSSGKFEITFIDSSISCNKELQLMMNEGNTYWEYSADVVPEDECLYIFTSGTTSSSRVVVHTFDGLMMYVLANEFNAFYMAQGDAFLNYAPLNHMGGLGRVYLALSIGACVVLMRKYDPVKFLENIGKYRPKGLLLIPATAIYALKELNEKLKIDLSSVERIETGATIIPPDSIEAMFELFPNASVSPGYGQSECSPITVMVYTKENFSKNPGLIDSCGVASHFCEIRIVDEEGNELPCGEVGELWVRSPYCMKHYLSDKSGIVDGWLHTGDLLRKDENGYYYFVDRKKDIIKTGGEIVSSYEIEKILFHHPAVKEAAVIGLPSKRFGEIIGVVVIKNIDSACTEEELIEYARNNMPKYMAPKKVFFVDELPRNTTGKVLKPVLRKQYSEFGYQ